MQQVRPAVSRDPGTRHVLFRTLFRLVLLAAFATLSRPGFGSMFAMFLGLSTIYCAITAMLRREPMLDRSLTHWDEAAAYALLGVVVSKLA